MEITENLYRTKEGIRWCADNLCYLDASDNVVDEPNELYATNTVVVPDLQKSAEERLAELEAKLASIPTNNI